MALRVKVETVVIGIFYLVLIAVLIVPFQSLINSPTAFEEFQSGEKAELPGITICPFPEGEDEIKDFIDAVIAIEKTQKEYLGQMLWTKSYHEW
jgi:hypothetical protein